MLANLRLDARFPVSDRALPLFIVNLQGRDRSLIGSVKSYRIVLSLSIVLSPGVTDARTEADGLSPRG